MPRANPPSRRQQGFTLIELMVGVVLGMLAIVAIAQVLVVSEGRKRTITSGADAQISGALGLYAIQREVQMAGYGIGVSQAALGCTVKYKNGSSALGSFTLAPVVIGTGTNGSNTIQVLRSTKTSFSVPIRITEAHPVDGTRFVVQSSVGVIPNDLLIAVPPLPSATDWCTISQAYESGTNLMTNLSVPHAQVADAPWNQPSTANVMPAMGYAAGSYLLNLGAMSLRTFSVNNTTQSLQTTDLTRDSGGWTSAQDAQPQVVVLKAMYGKDTNNDQTVDQYDNVAPTNAAEWKQVLSIRVVIVARSAQFEKDNEGSGNVTGSALEWDLGPNTVTVANATTCHTDHQCLSITLTHLGDDWQKYRYKLYDTVIPLRNVLWNS